MALTDKLTAIADAIRVRSGKTGKLTLAQMPDEIINLRSLNFEIVGNPQPENPEANTIWINTDTEITGWALTASEPDLVDGFVWITVGDVSPVAFNALEENCLMVYPLSAKQCIDGAWVAVTAMSYQGGAWVEWSPEGALYWHGDECEAVSGGWQARGWAASSTYKNTVTPEISFEDDHMQITVGAGGVRTGAVEVVNDQDLTDINSITIDYEMTTNTYIVYLVVIDRTATYMDSRVASALLSFDSSGSQVNSGTFARRTATLDVSGVSGRYDVAIRFTDSWSATGASPGVDMKVYSVLKE